MNCMADISPQRFSNYIALRFTLVSGVILFIYTVVSTGAGTHREARIGSSTEHSRSCVHMYCDRCAAAQFMLAILICKLAGVPLKRGLVSGPFLWGNRLAVALSYSTAVCTQSFWQAFKLSKECNSNFCNHVRGS